MLFRGGVGCGLLAVAAAWAQPPSSVDVATVAPKVRVRGDTLSVTVTGRRISALQPLERELVLGAQELLLRHLCVRHATANERLTGALRGMQVVESREDDGVLTVVVQVPRQDPRCEVLRPVGSGSAEVPAARRAPPASPVAPASPVPPFTVHKPKGEM